MKRRRACRLPLSTSLKCPPGEIRRQQTDSARAGPWAAKCPLGDALQSPRRHPALLAAPLQPLLQLPAEVQPRRLNTWGVRHASCGYRARASFAKQAPRRGKASSKQDREATLPSVAVSQLQHASQRQERRRVRRLHAQRLTQHLLPPCHAAPAGHMCPRRWAKASR